MNIDAASSWWCCDLLGERAVRYITSFGRWASGLVDLSAEGQVDEEVGLSDGAFVIVVRFVIQSLSADVGV